LGDTAAFLAVFVAEDSNADTAWSQRLATLPPQVDLLRVFACNPDGRVVYDSARGRDVGEVYHWPMRGGGPFASENYTISNVAEVNGELRVAAPVRRSGQMIGWVGVGRPLTSVAEGVSRARWGLVWSLGSIAAVMVAAGWWIASKLTHSLERLTEYAVAVRDGRSAIPPQSRAAEVAALARAFEEMRVSLEGKAYVERYTQALAHEFKSPLSAIRGAAELLAENPPEQDRMRFIANLRAESDRMRLIVDRLFELAALESRRREVGTARVDLAAVLGEVARGATAIAEMRRIKLSVVADGSAVVHGEHVLLVQAVDNLLQNALEFTPPGGAVNLSLSVRQPEACIVIEDTGCGIPEYALGKIFDRFFSLPRPDSGRKSSGLGLSIVREIARLHQGEIELANRPGGGTRAALTLPLA
jgi:two-component system sensor histidine kinase CreC